MTVSKFSDDDEALISSTAISVIDSKTEPVFGHLIGSKMCIRCKSTTDIDLHINFGRVGNIRYRTSSDSTVYLLGKINNPDADGAFLRIAFDYISTDGTVDFLADFKILNPDHPNTTMWLGRRSPSEPIILGDKFVGDIQAAPRIVAPESFKMRAMCRLKSPGSNPGIDIFREPGDKLEYSPRNGPHSNCYIPADYEFNNSSFEPLSLSPGDRIRMSPFTADIPVREGGISVYR